ncbi:Uncharacterized protein MSYG_0108 [Malassezia sympodialis ATCC 42132]|uniref:Uncharacterized protein n=1 Tax=Malassezia sympodialis (strain ATCC 42132) TaxID=1230383 RepID=A0A1M8A005_MALS4|nr:Uncharacterized protein MSYG_0108 [Malassezia sympodialis ATCC 42132]
METEAPHAPPIAVKVMRVSAPTLATRSIPMFEAAAEGAAAPDAPPSAMAWDPSVWEAIEATYARGSDAPAPGDTLPLREASWTDQLLLPASFGTVAVGQTFQAVVCVANTGVAPLTGVRIVLEMHSEATDKFVATSCELASVTLPEPLAPQAQHCLVATHTLEAMAPHALVCRIRSDRGTNEHWLSKQYRFPVAPPPFSISSAAQLSEAVAHTRHPDACVRDRTVVRMQVRNVSERPLYLDALALETDATWDVHAEPLDPTPLLPQDIRQYLCTLTPKREVTWPLLLTQRDALATLPAASTTLPLALRLGHVQVAWRVPGGEPGRLRVGPLTRVAHIPRPRTPWYAELHVDPVRARVDEACVVQARVRLWAWDAVHEAPAHVLWELSDASEACVVGARQHTTALPHGEQVAVQATWTVVPLQDGVVRLGTLSLYMVARSGARELVRAWPCMAEVPVAAPTEPCGDAERGTGPAGGPSRS